MKLFEIEKILKKYTLSGLRIPPNFFDSNILDLKILNILTLKIKENIPWVFENEEALSSGSIAFLLGVLYSRSKGISEYDDAILHFILIYINIDYTLDNPKISKADKKSIIRECKDYFQHLDISKIKNSQILPSVKSINYILENSNCKLSTLKKCFIEEKKTSKMQKTCKDRNTLLEICKRKAHACFEVLFDILGVVENDSKNLSFLGQLIDDLFDLENDIADEIKTIVTHDVENFKSLKKLIDTFLYTIDGLENKLHSTIFTYAIIMYAATSPYLPQDYIRIFKKYYPLEWEGIEYKSDPFIRNIFVETIKYIKLKN